MAQAAEQEWQYAEIARKFESGAGADNRPHRGRRILRRPAVFAAHMGVWLGIVVLGLIGLVTLHVAILQKNIEYNDLVREKNLLTSENARLSGEVSSLSSPERIEQIATDLGMVPPEKMQYVYIGAASPHQNFAELETTRAGR